MGELITEPKIIRNVLSARPAPGAVQPGDYFFAEDTGEMFQSNGVGSWGPVSSATRYLLAQDSNSFRNGGPASSIRESVSRIEITSVALTGSGSGGMYSVGIPLFAGDVVTWIGFRSGTTALATPTAWWFALYSSQATPALIAQTANQAAAAWGASTAMELALPTPYVVPVDGFYYVGYSVTAGTVPTLTGFNAQQNAVSTGLVTGQRSLAQLSGSSLGATAPATITGASATATVAYAWVR